MTVDGSLASRTHQFASGDHTLAGSGDLTMSGNSDPSGNDLASFVTVNGGASAEIGGAEEGATSNIGLDKYGSSRAGAVGGQHLYQERHHDRGWHAGAVWRRHHHRQASAVTVKDGASFDIAGVAGLLGDDPWLPEDFCG